MPMWPPIQSLHLILIGCVGRDSHSTLWSLICPVIVFMTRATDEGDNGAWDTHTHTHTNCLYTPHIHAADTCNRVHACVHARTHTVSAILFSEVLCELEKLQSLSATFQSSSRGKSLFLEEFLTSYDHVTFIYTTFQLHILLCWCSIIHGRRYVLLGTLVWYLEQIDRKPTVYLAWYSSFWKYI